MLSSTQKIIKLNVIKCVVQNCKKCSATSQTICSICNSGFYVSNGTCKEEPSETSKALTITVQSLVAVSAFSNIISIIMNASSAASICSLINQVQLFFLLLITRSFMPVDIINVIIGLKFVLNPFSYIKFEKLSYYNSIIDNFNFPLSNSLLDPLEIKSDSCIYNTSSIFAILILMIFMHIFILILNRIFEKYCCQARCICLIKIVKYIVKKLYSIMTFGYYILSALQLNQYLLICIIYESYLLNTSQSNRIISLITAYVILTSCLVLIFMSIYLALSSYKVIENKHNKFGNFFIGLKEEKKYKIYSSALLIRRMIYVLLLSFTVLQNISSRIVIGILSFLQIAYFIYISFLRPFKETKANIIEILNEAYFFFLLITLIPINKESEWSSTKTSAYMWTIVSNSTSVFFIIFANLCISSIKRCCKIGSEAKQTQNEVKRKVNPKKVLKTSKLQLQNEYDPNIQNLKSISKTNLHEENKSYNDDNSMVRIHENYH